MICGVDEAGRGPLAGPVFAAAVVLGPSHGIRGLADSKLLSPGRRAKLAAQIRERAMAWSLGSATAAEIDEFNILRATLLAMRRALEALRIEPSEILVDGLHCPQTAQPVRAIVRGDRTVPEISAASILAKTARDAAMMELHALYPDYGFDRHKGYPTSAHLEALHMHGVSAVHRQSFAPVREILQRGRGA